MADFNVRSDAVNVKQIMDQIRARIREKRGVDYTEEQIRELASVKLEKFLDPRGVRSDLLEQFRRAQPPYAPPDLPNYAFEADTLFASTRVPLRWIRKLLLPILKLFFNPNPLIQALNIQSRLNASYAEREARRDAARYSFDQLHYEVMHNLVLETTRLGIEVKNLKMRIESLASRLEFTERRARALESVVVYKPSQEERPAREESRRDENRRQAESRRQDQPQAQARQQPYQQQPPPPAEAAAANGEAAVDVDAAGQAVQPGSTAEGPGQRSRRRRRRRGRRGSGSAAALMAGAAAEGEASLSEAEQDQGIDEGGAESDAFEGEAESGSSESSSAPDGDTREVRPEPFEHTFGAQAHPAETTVSDPSPVTPAGGAEAPKAESHEPPSADPSASSEQ